MAFNYNALRGKIREKYQTEREFAKALGLSQTSLSAKLNGKVAFTNNEIYLACQLLDVPLENSHIFFLATDLSLIKAE